MTHRTASGAAFATALADEEPLVRYTAVTQTPVTDGETFVDQITPLLLDESRLVRMEAMLERVVDGRDSRNK